MKTTPVISLVNSVQGTLRYGNGTSLIQSVSIDSRKIDNQCAFFALKGERFDAHDFLDKAIDGGAQVLVVSHLPEGVDFSGVDVVEVKDTLVALQQFAHWYRRNLKIKVVAVTGSNGKTSTKDFTKSVLGIKYRVTATVGNLNNHIGLPLSILAAEESDDVAIWEMGMNHPGEIAPLCSIAHPDIGIITNVGTAHIEHMGSIEAIAEEKGELAKCLPQNGTLVVSAACDHVDYFAKRTLAHILVVGNGRGKVRAERLQMSASGSRFDLVIESEPPVSVTLPVVGRHMVANALLAAGAGHVLGMSAEEIALGLNQSILTSGRLRVFEVDGITVFDDTYNANPESMAAAIETLAELNQSGVNIAKRYAVFGKMAELGDHADEAHLAIGKLAAERGIITVSVGQEAQNIHRGAVQAGGESQHFNNNATAAAWLKQHLAKDDVVLFKGSRAAGMEQVMNEVFKIK